MNKKTVTEIAYIKENFKCASKKIKLISLSWEESIELGAFLAQFGKRFETTTYEVNND